MVLILHLLLAGGLGVLVLFFRGVVHYMAWIFLGGSFALAASGYQIFRRLRAERNTLTALAHPLPRAVRPVEIRILGGFLSIRYGMENRCSLGDTAELTRPGLQLPTADSTPASDQGAAREILRRR